MIITYNTNIIYNSQPQSRNKSGLLKLQNQKPTNQISCKNIFCNNKYDIVFKSSSKVLQKDALKRLLYEQKLATVELYRNKKINSYLKFDNLLEKTGKSKNYEEKIELLKTIIDNSSITNQNHGLIFIPNAKKIFDIGKKIAPDKTLKEILLLALNDKSGRVRAVTYKLLGNKFNSDKKIKTVLLRSLGTDKCRLAKTAIIKALGGDFEPDKNTKNILKEILKNDKYVRVRIAAANVLGKNYNSDPEIKELLLKLFKNDKKTRARWLNNFEPEHIVRIRVVTAKILGKYFISDEEIRKTLVHVYTTDKNKRIRIASALYLNKNADKL